MPDMVEVLVDSVRVSLMSPQRLVVLREKEADRFLPIWVGQYEAEAITIALQEVEMARPLTHDLLRNVFSAFEASLVRVEIVALREDIFYGNIVAEIGGKAHNIDARPSDAIALAVRAHIPILVGQAVMDSAGIVPERDLQEQAPSEPARGPAQPPSPESEDRLSIFEDYMKKIDKDGENKKDKPEN